MGRKGSGVEQRENSIRIRFTLDGQPMGVTLKGGDGKPVPPTPANLKRAHRIAADVKDAIRLGTFSMAQFFPESGAAAVGDVAAQLDTWLSAQRVEASTRAGYESAVRFWKAAPANDHGTTIGALPLRALRHSHVLFALAARPDLSGKTVNNYISVLRQAVELAVLDRLLPSNPIAAVPRAKWQRDPPDPFSRAEAEAIIADMRKHYPEPVFNLVEWWFFAGPRPSEAVGLRWPSVDLASEQVAIKEAVVRGVAKKTTKTAVTRTIQMNSRAAAAIQRQRKHTQMAGEYVWLDPRYGTPWTDERAFRRSYWEPTLKRLGIRYRPPRNMRHTYATMMLMARRTPAWCARQLGHSVEMFLNTYSKWIEGEQDEREIRGLEDWLSAPALPQRVSD